MRQRDRHLALESAGRPSLGAPLRGHTRQLWLTAVGIIALAALLAVSITTLRSNADGARKVQLLVAHMESDVHKISRIEWQGAAERRISPELGAEFQETRGHIDADLLEYSRSGDARQALPAQTQRYLNAVARQLALLDAGRVADSREIDEREVDPAFDRLEAGLDTIYSAESGKADGAARATDLGVAASLLLAALVLILVLWRLDRIRGAAARERRVDLEAQALQDSLTGLPNRRGLMLDLEQALLDSAGGERRVLALCDLDGFKAYNDHYGHLEGDLLLRRLSAKLARVVAPHGTAYRLGGDEFCALLRGGQDELQPVIAACHGALRESGSGFDITASLGSVALSVEASDSSNALRLADQRMYSQKRDRGSSVQAQLRDLILRVHHEHDPTLRHHVHDVASFAAGVGRRLGLDHAQVGHLVYAAELHDVGKVAIPESILNKPGPLDDREMEFMRRHTLVGESILGAAPALAGVGRLVRSSHERFDGTGYPDGLRAEEIPLSSRIIFVCDSFDAMTTDRPYRDAMSVEGALDELRQCARTQFDPAVVTAFAAELAERNAAGRDRDEDPHAPAPAAVA
jgi:diguanylate cyclase (GGDEF)-like protein